MCYNPIIRIGVQRFPRAREAIKYLVKDGRYHYIETGSLISINEKRFNLQTLGKSARMRNCDASFEWFASAMTVNLCYGASEPNVGLELNADRLSLKCYLGDTGLLVSQAFGESDLQREAIHDRLLSDRIEINAGMLVENVVAQMLRTAGHDLYFYSRYDREDAAQNMEIDFLIDKPGLTRRHNISPVEVKSSREYTTTSLDRFRTRFSACSAQPYILHEKNLAVVDGVIRLPLYMAPWLVTGGKVDAVV